MALDRRDAALFVVIALIVGLHAAFFVDFSKHPFEDAAMLMRYSQHVAAGQGIVWNAGDEPVDGATDFLSMVFVAGLAKMMPVEIAARTLAVVAHILTVLLLYLALREFQPQRRWVAFVSALFFALGPGLRYAAAYFTTPLFALFAALAWYCCIRLTRQNTQGISVFFALSCLLLGLIRPEGVLLAFFFALALLAAKGREAIRPLSYLVVLYGIIGGAYFAWRWHYFGYPLPNPFYLKGGGHIYIASVVAAVRNLLTLALPFLLVMASCVMAFLACLFFRRPQWTSGDIAVGRSFAFHVIPLAGFTLIWVLLSDEMNYLMRFQYALLPVVLLSWPMLFDWLSHNVLLPRPGRTAAGIIVVVTTVLLLAGAVADQQLGLRRADPNYPDGRYDVARLLSGYSANYTIATTEAGLLPFYSGWRAIDAWGLNDKRIAHEGLTAEYLDQSRPEVIMFHAHYSPQIDDFSTTDSRAAVRDAMTRTLHAYAKSRNYTLAAVFADNLRDSHYYYVRPDFADSAAITAALRSMEYAWYANGKKAINLAIVPTAS